jgi:hypothetical protein
MGERAATENDWSTTVIRGLVWLVGVVLVVAWVAFALVPQLVNSCDRCITERRFSVHAAQVYKLLNAALAEDAKATPASILARYGRDCRLPTTPKQLYSWQKAPDGVVFCSIAAQKNDFLVAVVGIYNSKYFISVNGAKAVEVGEVQR